ncbi:MAG: A/G-specific adenine glycosylase [Cystobacterineae bacterium]|nr:A/G-specific adenine glycosylase [Cystobacterineae bacterium]
MPSDMLLHTSNHLRTQSFNAKPKATFLITPMPSKTSNAQLLKRLAKWYAKHGRKLPWRGCGDAYAIWVSEIMLQQTQVGTVLGYFERFMQRFPRLESLAKAPLEEVLSLWQGLGYYGRCRKLHAAAQQLLAAGQTQLPSSLEALSALPGFGPYTAGAVASIAFGLPVPAIDGNLLRLCARLHALPLPKERLLPQVHRWVSQLLQTPRPPRSAFPPGSLNQALMDLGATVCKPRNPLCTECPWHFACLALAQNKVTTLPLRKQSKPKPTLSWLLAYIEFKGQLLMAQHPPKGLFGGLWGLPGVPVERRLLSQEASQGSPLSQHLGGYPLALLCQTQRELTHRHLQLFVYAMKGKMPPKGMLQKLMHFEGTQAMELKTTGIQTGGTQPGCFPGYACLRWVPRETALQLPTSAALRKALEAALAATSVHKLKPKRA